MTWQKHELQTVRGIDKTCTIYSRQDFEDSAFEATIYVWSDHAVWRLVDFTAHPGDAYGDEVYSQRPPGPDALEKAKIAVQQKYDELHGILQLPLGDTK